MYTCRNMTNQFALNTERPRLYPPLYRTRTVDILACKHTEPSADRLGGFLALIAGKCVSID